MENKQWITISAVIDAPVEKVWACLNEPEHIVKWNFAIPEWHCPSASNDLRVGGKLVSRMEARDGSMGFDFGGVYDEVEPYTRIAYTLGDGRRVKIDFKACSDGVLVEESFEAESQNSVEMQRGGWQAILNNFKAYTESVG